jgi:carotenoid 1,2-hydratase
MPTLPLYDALAHPNAWHRVTAPGGYEWWRFEANDSAGLELRVEFFDGHPFSGAYRRAYARYRRRPTRVTPPGPRDFPAAGLVVMDKGRELYRAEIPYPAGAFSASADGSEINIGEQSMRRDRTGVIRLAMVSYVFMDLTFRPLQPGPPELQQIDSPQRSTTHFHVVNRCEYAVSGSLRGLEANVGRGLINFDGRGRHDHFYGTGPIDVAMAAVHCPASAAG